MLNVLSINDVSVIKDGYVIINNLSFDIKQGTFVSVVGCNGSGKTTLVRLLSGLEKYSGYISVNGYYLDNESRNNIFSGISVVFDNIHSEFLRLTVWDNLVVGLINLGKSKSFIDRRVNEICKMFDIDKNILNVNINLLDKEFKQLIHIASAVITKPSFLVLDDCMNCISITKRKRIINTLNKLKNDTKMSILMITNNINDVLNTDRLMVFNDGKIVMDGKVISILKQGDKLVEYGLQLPYVVELSLELVKRNKITNIYFDERKLVDALWK